MKHPIHSAQDLALAVRAARKSSGIRQDDLAGIVQVSKQFTADVEHGKPTTQLGLVIQLLKELGLSLTVDLPESAVPELRRLETLRAAGKLKLKPFTRERTQRIRKSSPPADAPSSNEDE